MVFKSIFTFAFASVDSSTLFKSVNVNSPLVSFKPVSKLITLIIFIDPKQYGKSGSKVGFTATETSFVCKVYFYNLIKLCLLNLKAQALFI